ncbi:MAG: hypothetical protein IJR20_05840 [Muribaculaceae bacterium]|nr:hypothetical protein [Muribaculaceae bacterium]
MVEGINMGRKSPWTKEEYISAYNEISDYAKRLSAKLLISEGAKSAAEAISAYNIYKCPVVYLFIHYHYGKFEDLKMDNEETSAYLMMFLPNVKYFARELKKAFATGQVFTNSLDKGFDSLLIDMCEEIIYIEDNF